MKKSIILSERPRHACNIANKLKKLDIRRNAPENWVKYLRGETETKPEPIEVYIYVSKERTPGERLLQIEESDYHCKLERDCDNEDLECSCDILNQQIIAKFTLTEVEAINLPYTEFKTGKWVRGEAFRTLQTKTMDEPEILKKACLYEDEIYRYLNFSKKPCGYAWHIENVVVFDNAKKLSEFNLTKSPQSWGYGKHDSLKEVLL